VRPVFRDGKIWCTAESLLLLDGHRSETVRANPIEERLHVFHRVNGHPNAAHFSAASGDPESIPICVGKSNATDNPI
jgi:hypothetical protein